MCSVLNPHGAPWENNQSSPGIAIYDGDPRSPVGSAQYDSYLRGQQAAGVGSLVFYVAFTLTMMVLELMLDKLGRSTQYILTLGVKVKVGFQ